jgi:hypothetical protein
MERERETERVREREREREKKEIRFLRCPSKGFSDVGKERIAAIARTMAVVIKPITQKKESNF